MDETPVGRGLKTCLESAKKDETPALSLTLVPEPSDLYPGAVPIAGYRLVRFLGQGGFGTVWEAEAPGGIRVALKFIWLHDPRVDRELRALDVIRNVRHPHLLDVQFAVRRRDYLVVAMPLCDQSLEDRLRTCREQGSAGLPLGELLGYMSELAGAIDYLNEPRHPLGNGRLGGIQHRDIKPQNVLLAGGSARLADFGLAKLLEENLESHSGCMSPHYVAPEVLRGEFSQHSDQYSLAVTYHQLRTGRLPFTGSIGEVLDGHLHEIPDLSGLPDGERMVVARALAKCPEQRWPTCREFVRQLERLAAQPEVHYGTIAPSSPACDTTADPDAGRDEARPTKEAVPSDEFDPTRRRDHRSPKSRPHRFGRVATGLRIVGLTAVLCASLAPPTPPSHISRAQDRSGHERRRGHGFPSRQAPSCPRSPYSGRRIRNQTHSENTCEFRRFESHQRGGSLPRLRRNARHFVRPQSALVRQC